MLLHPEATFLSLALKWAIVFLVHSVPEHGHFFLNSLFAIPIGPDSALSSFPFPWSYVAIVCVPSPLKLVASLLH